MKRVITSIIVGIPLYVFSQNIILPADEIKESGFKGNVKFVMQYEGEAMGVGSSFNCSNMDQYSYLGFDQNGKLNNYYSMNNGTINSFSISSYDQNGFRKHFLSYRGSDSVLTDSTEFIYDLKKGIGTRYTYSFNDRSTTKTEMIHNQKGQVWKKLDYGIGIIVLSTTQFTYDNQGNVIKETFYDENEKMLNYKVYTYDLFNNKVSEKMYDSSDNMIENFTFVYEYDVNINWRKRIKFNGSIPVWVTERIIDYY